MRIVGLVLTSMRPRQWTKNLVVFAPLIFAGALKDASALASTVLLFAAFCCASGAAYLFNDVADLATDRANPERSHRPIAAGELSTAVALVAATGAALAGVALAWAAAPASIAWVAGFLALQAAYSLALKRIAYLDALAIAGGFVVRVESGSFAAGVPASLGMLASAAALAFFLALAKRHWELVVAGENVHRYRPSAKGYSAAALRVWLLVMASTTLGAYRFWMLEEASGGASMLLPASTWFVALGLARYLWLVFRRNDGGRPEHTLVTDTPLIVDLVLWGAVLYVGLYLLV